MLNELRLPTIGRLWAEFAERSDKEGWQASRLLGALLEHELAERAKRRIERHRTESHLDLILDDLSYARKDQAETSVLFELIAERYERKSLLITANQPFSGWNDVFPDPGMTVAAIDRLVHHSTIFELNVESYRRRKASDKQTARQRQLPNDNYDGGAGRAA